MRVLAGFAAITAGLLAMGGLVTADVESPALAKYKKPVEEAVERGLGYLAKHQIASGQPLAGSFESPGIRGNPGVTALCVMAFLSKGHTPGTGKYGEVIDRAIDYVLSTQDSKTNLLIGPHGGWGQMYTHSIATLMLAEVSGMVDPDRQRKIDVVLPKALNLIVSAQRIRKSPAEAGGWRYQPTSTDSDISQTGWAVMALRAGRLNGAAVPRECIEDAVNYILRCRRPDGGFAYRSNGERGSGLARTGVAVLCLELCGRHGEPAGVAGAEYILRTMPRTATPKYYVFYYGEYYCSQAMFQLGGKYWETWAPVMYDLFIKAQQADGSWPIALDYNADAPGTCYATAMAVLAVTVSYRQLPIYQR